MSISFGLPHRENIVMVSLLYLQSKHSSNRTWREPSAENVLPLGDYDQKRRMIEEEQKREYQEFLKKVHTSGWVCILMSGLIFTAGLLMCSCHTRVMDKLQEAFKKIK